MESYLHGENVLQNRLLQRSHQNMAALPFFNAYEASVEAVKRMTATAERETGYA